MSGDAGQIPLSLQPMDRNADVLWRVLDLIRERLPRKWSCRLKGEDVKLPTGHVDALIEISGPDDLRATLAAEIRLVAVTRELRNVVDQLRSIISGSGRSLAPIVVARYLSPSARNWLEGQQVSYADATGNLRIVLDSPGLFLRDAGSDRDPWRGPGRPRGTLHGAPAARVVRTLLDHRPPISMTALVEISKASTGATYRVVDFLEEEALIEREKRGPIVQVAWRSLLERWSKDYSFQVTNTVGSFLQPRGIPGLLESLRDVKQSYVVTGSLAAHNWAPYAPARLAMIYVTSVARFASEAGLRVVDSGANVLLAGAKYDVVFDRLVRVDGIRYAAPSQVAVDLLTGPGRNPAEAEMLMDWMQNNELEWRR
jgi:hypothetical protein